MDGKTVLVIDDEARSLEVTATLLRKAGLTVRTAQEWTQVTETLFQGGGADLILVDVNMPAFTGDRLVPILTRHAGADTPVILYSGLPEERLAELAAGCGASGFLQKGKVAGHALVTRVLQHLNGT